MKHFNRKCSIICSYCSWYMELTSGSKDLIKKMRYVLRFFFFHNSPPGAPPITISLTCKRHRSFKQLLKYPQGKKTPTPNVSADIRTLFMHALLDHPILLPVSTFSRAQNPVFTLFLPPSLSVSEYETTSLVFTSHDVCMLLGLHSADKVERSSP
jgi:hypothetical protein